METRRHGLVSHLVHRRALLGERSTHVLVLVRRTNNDLLISDLGPEVMRSGSIAYIHLDYDSCQVHSQLASGTAVDRTVLYTSEAKCAHEEYTCVSMYVTAISQHVKKTRKYALREKVDRCDDDGKWTGDDDDDGQVRRGGTAIAMGGTEAGGGQRMECHHAR